MKIEKEHRQAHEATSILTRLASMANIIKQMLHAIIPIQGRPTGNIATIKSGNVQHGSFSLPCEISSKPFIFISFMF